MAHGGRSRAAGMVMMPTMMTLMKLLIVRASPWMHRSAWASSTAAQYPSKVEALTRCWFCRTNKEVPCELHDRREAWGAAGAHRDEAVMRKCAEPSGRCGHQKQSEVNLGGFSGIPQH